MNPDLWYRPDPTLTWPAAPELRQNNPGMPPSWRHAGKTVDHPIPSMPASFTFVFTGRQPDGAPQGAGQELSHALIRILDAHLAQEQARREIDFEGEPFL
jgi:hypothetical protein